MNKFLVPFDGSRHALKALHIACDLAEKYNGSLEVLYVILPAVGEVKPSYDEAEVILDIAREKLNARGLAKTSLKIEKGEPTETILVAIKSFKATTIVMGCRGRLDDEIEQFGSVSQEVFQRADCTCICVK